jgi:hypothetical protein
MREEPAILMAVVVAGVVTITLGILSVWWIVEIVAPAAHSWAGPLPVILGLIGLGVGHGVCWWVVYTQVKESLHGR